MIKRRKLLAIGGTKSWEWLSWDGRSEELIIPIPPKIRFSTEPELMDLEPLKVERYFVWDMGNFVTQQMRKVYVNEHISSPKTAEIMLKDHLLELFIGVGDVTE